jgi:exodeoxyribonuclease VII large subunit
VSTDHFWTVAQLVGYLKRTLDDDPLLQRLWVVGEISNFKAHSSGHWYFSLKDSAQIRAVMFRTDADRVGFLPENGQAVLAFGRISVFERDGQVQFYVRRLEPVGAGQRFLELEALKRRLQEEGWFSRPKRPLPVLPRIVGVATSRSGAALHDILTVARRRLPTVRLLVAPVLVQGQDAPASIARAVERLGRHPGVDVVIVARGGGSQEDLAAFNTEVVVKAIAQCPRPVVSAVGHEVDVTLADLAADVRAATPSAAAELVVPDGRQLLLRVESLRVRLARHLEAHIGRERRRLLGMTQHGVLARPELWLEGRKLRVVHWQEALDRAARAWAERQRIHLGALQDRLDSLNPLAVLQRGYSVVTRADGQPLRVEALRPQDALDVRWASARWRVEAREPLDGASLTGGGRDLRGGVAGTQL